VEFTANLRGAKYLMFGGVTTDRRATTSCDERDNPNGLRFCDSIGPFRSTVKASGAYTMKYDVQVSGSFSSIPAGGIGANYTVTAAVAGRPAGSVIGSVTGATSTTINLIEPGSMYLDRQNRFDLRLGKNFRFGNRKIQGFMDVFNVLNAGTITRVNETYAASGTNLWLTPQAIMEGRYVRFGTQMTF
jgi:hypothetical protein